MPGNNEVFNVTIKAGVDLSGVEQQAKKLKGLFDNVDFKIPKNVSSSFDQHYSDFTKLFKQYQVQLNKGFNTKGEVNSFKTLGKAVAGEINNMIQDINKLNNSNVSFNIDTAKVEELSGKIDQIRNKIQTELSNVNIDFDKMFAGASKSSKLKEMLEDFKQAFNSGDMQQASAQIDRIKTKILSLTTTKTNMVEALGLSHLVNETKTADSVLEDYFNDLKNGLASANTEKLAKLFKDLGIAEKDLNNYFSDTTKKVNDHIEAIQTTGDATRDAFKAGKSGADSYANSLQSAKQQLDSLKQSTEYFFGLRNMFNLLKRGIREAIQTVSELDKAMTETAVVTEFNVGDMWNMLPQYTEQANKLGSTIKDVYEATTLYYQQGLDTNQAIGLANETLKMARIAGMEAAEATDAMTAALRGFNMEINEMSAQRINDVYSKIAATTASNTEELSTAMTKTASLAHSAGMSFEGTTAFLAQMIETTREAPENLGTAMKTIVARFQEMKKNPLEIVDVEGEEVSYNKIDEALQSIGVSLKDTNGQFRNLDEVFLEISSKWDSLTQTQQRYIATTAAGSRQQSRFIAMMSNYERVTQLVDYANNSAGASQEQFGKTLESFEAKVNKLKNAWQEYLMGITDNVVIKKAIDLMTKGLDRLNKIIDSLSTGLSKLGINESLAQSIISLTSAFIGLKAAGRIANRAISGIGGFLDPKSSFFKGFFSIGKGTGQASSQAALISNPIVSAIHQLQAALTGKAVVVNGDTSNNVKANYKDNFKQIRTLGNTNKFSDASSLFNGLTDQEQRSLLVNSGGSKLQLQNAASSWFKGLNLDAQAQKAGIQIQKSIWRGMSKGQISVTEGMKLLGEPQKWGEFFGDDLSKSVSKAYMDKFPKAMTVSAEKAMANAQKGAQRQLGFKGQDAAFRQALQDPKIQRQYNELVNNNLNKVLPQLGAETLKDLTPMQKMANAVGKLGNGFTQAGYAVSSFGTILKQIGGPLDTVGSALESVGGIVASLGMAISGLATGIPAIVEVLGGPLTIVLAAIAAIGTFAFTQHTKHLKEVHETAQKVVDDYKTINKSTSDNIATLKQYKDELAELSKGVDKNGLNVNLSTTDYDRYLEIVDKIAEINPDIVKYYNEQGHAVLDLNNALEDTLELEEKRQKEALRTYTSQTSLQALLDDRAENKTWKEYSSDTAFYSGKGEVENKKSIKYKVKNLATDLESKGFNLDRLTKYGIDSKALLKGEARAIQLFTKNQDKILHEAEISLATSWDTVGDGITNAFTDLGDAVKEFNEINQPIFEQLATWIGQDNRFQELGAEQKGFVTTGLQSIVMEDMDAPTMRKEARKVVREIDRQFGKGSPYENIMSRVKAAQEAFALDLDEQKYNNEIGGLIEELETLRDESEDIGGAAGEALYNAYTRELDSLTNQAGQSAQDIMEALNPLSDEIASAEGAFSKFQEQTSSDFSTASKNMKQFFDVLNDDEHKAGYGDKSYWLAAKEVFSEKALQGKMKPGNLKKMQEQVEPLFEEGAKGFNNFVDYIDKFKNNDVVKKFLYNDKGKLQFDFDDENIHEIAEALKLSDNSFTALLNKARQFAKIRFGNTEELREGLVLSDTTVFGKSTTDGGEGNIYINREQIIADAYSSGAINNPTEEADFIKQLENANIKTIPGPGSLDADHFDNWKGEFEGTFKEWKDKFKEDVGITSKGSEGIKESIAVFDKMGYGKEDIYQYTKTLLGKKNVSAEDFNNVYDAYVEEQNLDPVTEGMSTIEATLETIANILAGGEVAAGNLNPERLQSENLQQGTFGENNVWDTMADMFAHGFNEFGQKLSEQEYQANLETLQGYRETADNYLNELYEGLKNVNPYDKEKVTLYESEINKVREYIGQVDEAITSGTEVIKNRNIKEGQQKYQEQVAKISPEKIEAELDITAETNFSEARGDYVEYKEEVEDNPPVIKPSTVKPKTDTSDIGKATDTATKDGEAIIYFKPDTTKVEQGNQEVVEEIEKPVKKPIGLANYNETLQDINNINDKASKSVNKTVNLKLAGGEGTFKVSAAAKGLNNHISSIGFYAGSMAKGSKGGTLGPKGKGGTTLTGEKGFEIAWLPSEQRSMILGAKGPQLVDLPSDAVVWNHEQSKKIVKQKGIPAGSLSDVESEEITKWEESSDDGKKTTKKTTTKKKNKDNKEIKAIDYWYKTEIKRFNWVQKINDIVKDIENNSRKIDKTINKIGTKYEDVEKLIKQQNKEYEKGIKTQEKVKDSYKDELKKLNGTYKNKDGKKVSRALHFDYTNSGGESKQKKIKTGDYITNKNGYYEVDQKAVEKYFKANPKTFGKEGSERYKENIKAFIDMLTGAINTAQSGYDNADKAIQEYTDKIEDNNQKLEDWEKNLPYENIERSLLERWNREQQLNKVVESIADEAEKVEKVLEDITSTWEEALKASKQQYKDIAEGQKISEKQRKSYETEGNNFIAGRRQIFAEYTNSNGTSKHVNIDPSQFMTGNAESGFQIDRDALKEWMKGLVDENGKKIDFGTGDWFKANLNSIAQTAMDEASRISDGWSEANDSVKDYQKQQKDLDKQIAQAFVGWKSELTQIYILTSQIAHVEATTKTNQTKMKSLTNQIALGLISMSDGLKSIGEIAKGYIDLLEKSKTLKVQELEAQKDEARKLRESKDERERYQEAQQYYKGLEASGADSATLEKQQAIIDEAKQEWEIAKKARELFTTTKDENGNTISIIDEEALESFKNDMTLQSDFKKAVEDHIKEIQNSEKGVVDLQNQVLDLDVQIQELEKQSDKTLADFEKELADALEAQVQKQIDSMEGLSESLDNAAQSILEQARRTLDARRQENQNAQTESDINKKEQRLAALRANTAGGNQVEIAQLEKEIAQDRQAYQESLEDQLLDKISQQNDDAKKQREIQIQIARQQLQYNKDQGKFMEEADKKIKNIEDKQVQDEIRKLLQGEGKLGEFGTKVQNEEFDTKMTNIVSSLATIAGIDKGRKNGTINEGIPTTEEKPITAEEQNKKISKIVDEKVNAAQADREAQAKLTEATNQYTEAMNSLKEAAEQQKQAVDHLKNAEIEKEKANNQYESAKTKYIKALNGGNQKEIDKASAKLKEAESKKAAADKNYKKAESNLKTANKNYDTARSNKNSADEQLEAAKTAQAATAAAREITLKAANKAWEENQKSGNTHAKGTLNKLPYRELKKGEGKIAKLKSGLNDLIDDGLLTGIGKLNNKDVYGDASHAAVKALQAAIGAKQTGKWDEQTALKLKYDPKFKYYATGGLANYTGPAWLDGTPSKPELVLNAQDTKNFMALKDILSGVIRSISHTDNSNVTNAPTEFNININVDKIANDYDVKQLANTLKKEIVKSASYRNVTSIRNLR